MKKTVKLSLIFILIFLLIIIELHLMFKPAPDTILIRLLNSEKNFVELNASCSADIITKEKTIYNKSLTEIESLYDYVDKNKVIAPSDKGYYELKTGLNGYRHNFEIKVTCISEDKKRESFEVFNRTHLPCEVKDKSFIVC